LILIKPHFKKENICHKKSTGGVLIKRAVILLKK